jgi:hypothetical protein
MISTLSGIPHQWDGMGGVAEIGAIFGFFLWMMRQFVRILQVARYYTR